MANVLISEDTMTDIADAIRSKKGVETTYLPSEMPSAIESISSGVTPTGTLEITSNGTYNVTNYASANVSVSTGGGGTDDPNHLALGEELVLECGNHNMITSGSTNIPVFQLAGSTSPTVRRSLYAANGDVRANCYYTTSGNGTPSNAFLIPIPTGATSVSLTVDKNCQVAPRDYIVENGVVLSGTYASGYTDIVANTPTAFEFTSGSTHLSFGFRNDSNNTEYTNSNIPTVITLDFSSGGGEGGDEPSDAMILSNDIAVSGSQMAKLSSTSFTVQGTNTSWTTYVQTLGNEYNIGALTDKDIVFKIRLSDPSILSQIHACFALTTSAGQTASSARQAFGGEILSSEMADGTGLFTCRVNYDDLGSSILNTASSHPSYYLKVYIFLNGTISNLVTASDIEFYAEDAE